MTQSIQTFSQMETDNVFLQLLDEGLNDVQKKMYMESFSAYLKYDQNTDFVVDLDDHWKGIGYSQKVRAVEAIEKNLEENVDYSYDKFIPGGSFSPEKIPIGGRPKTKIFLSVSAFKNLCMLAGTAEGKEIRKYFVALEGVTQKYLKIQFELKEKELLLSNSWIPSQDELNEHARILRFIGDKSNVFYQGKCQVPDDPRVYVKPGSVRSIRKLSDRVKEHEKDFSKFLLFQAIECTDAEYVESEFKKLQIIKSHNKRVKSKKINNTETLLLDETLTTSQLISAPFTAASEYIFDSPPAYSKRVLDIPNLDVEKERTKQKEMDMKQKEIDLEFKKLEFEIEKWRYETKERKPEALREENNEDEAWCRENIEQDPEFEDKQRCSPRTHSHWLVKDEVKRALSLKSTRDVDQIVIPFIKKYMPHIESEYKQQTFSTPSGQKKLSFRCWLGIRLRQI